MKLAHICQGDAENLPLADRSVDAVIGSPPYAKARTYSAGMDREIEAWAMWMADVTVECLRVTRGAVVWVVDDQVRQFRLRPGIALLQVELYLRGIVQERPLIWRSNKAPSRSGIWWSHTWEYILAFKRDAKRLPHFDWESTANPSKYKKSGAFRQRTKSGSRQAHEHKGAFAHPKLANPKDVILATVGGGHMGHPLATQNEAPYPMSLVEQLIPVLVPKGGLVLDPFSGSGTTVDAARKLSRVGIGMDLRFNQCQLASRRLSTI